MHRYKYIRGSKVRIPLIDEEAKKSCFAFLFFKVYLQGHRPFFLSPIFHCHPNCFRRYFFRPCFFPRFCLLPFYFSPFFIRRNSLGRKDVARF